MIRHIVGWKFQAEDAAGREVALGEVKNALESLVGVVPGLLDLSVTRAVPPTAPSDSDLGLVSHHETLADLRVYAEHPAHLAAVVIVKSHTRDRWAFDYEV